LGVGVNVGLRFALTDGVNDDLVVGIDVGMSLGLKEGCVDGSSVGVEIGLRLGLTVGVNDGFDVVSMSKCSSVSKKGALTVWTWVSMSD